MTAQTYSARQTARDVSKALGREVDAKRVRAWVRDHVDAYDDDGYTSHEYDHATHARIVKGMTASAKSGRASAARQGRKGASKAATTAKAASERRTVNAKPGTPATGTLPTDA